MRKVGINTRLTIPVPEIRFTHSRSGGPGGQHVNKVSTAVTLFFDVANSPSLTTRQKERILNRLRSRISSEGVLRLTERSERSQIRNREKVVTRFVALLDGALKESRIRVRTRPTRPSQEERLKAKKFRAARKKERRTSDGDHD